MVCEDDGNSVSAEEWTDADGTKHIKTTTTWTDASGTTHTSVSMRTERQSAGWDGGGSEIAGMFH